MKLLHTADLHIGKRVNEFSLIADQKYILQQILDIAKAEAPDALLITGDVYDKSRPATEAVELLDDFLTHLSNLQCLTFIIRGNHDSPERLGFGSRLFSQNGLHIVSAFNGTVPKATLTDKYGPVHIHLLPFIKPLLLKPFFNQAIETYDEALKAVLSQVVINPTERQVLLAHQFIVSGSQQPDRSESETVSVGGLDSADASLFDAFDYVALGHIHRPQSIGRETIRYAGSPLKYSFSEAKHNKSITLIQLGAKGDINLQLIPLTPLRDLRVIRGPLAGLLRAGQEDTSGAEDYIHATLTDEEVLYDPFSQLRQVFPHILSMNFDNRRSRPTEMGEDITAEDTAQKSPLALFEDFYALLNNETMTPQQQALMGRLLDEAGGEET